MSPLLPALIFAASTESKYVVRADETVAQQTQAEWSIRWWQWAASFDYADSPVADRTGERCAAGQNGDVWFLAGVYGSAPVKRRCQVPSGKWLFFPIVNYMAAPNPHGTVSCETVMASAQEYTDNPRDLTVLVDDVPVENLSDHRQAPRECFDLGARIGTRIYPTAGNGYYIALKPLPPGPHVIKWGGVLDTLRQAVVYEIVVSDDASATLL